MPSRQETDETISSFFTPLLATGGTVATGLVPGILVGVTCKGTHSYYPFGSVPMVQSGTMPATEDIVMFIGSNTKVVTATLLASAFVQRPIVPIDGFTEITSLLPTDVFSHRS